MLILAIAGCATHSSPSSPSAKEVWAQGEAAIRDVAGQDVVYAGTWSVEGPADWDDLHNALEQALGEGTGNLYDYMRVLLRFSLGAIHGPSIVADEAIGDGRAPRWDVRVAAPRGMISDVTWDGGYRGLVGHGTTCPATTPLAWDVDSTEAVEVANANKTFAALRASLPNGELWLDLSRKDGLFADDLGDECDTVQPHWDVLWTNLDDVLKDGARYVVARVSANEPAVRSVESGVFRLPTAMVWRSVGSQTGIYPVVGALGTKSWTFTVEDDPWRLDVQARWDAAAPVDEGVGGADTFGLRDPQGHVMSPTPGTWHWPIPHPTNGVWTITYAPGPEVNPSHATAQWMASTIG